MKNEEIRKALVIFSGGQDSTTCLAWARGEFHVVQAITFVYGQRHSAEVKAAEEICEAWGVHQKLVHMNFLPELVRSALTGNGDISQKHPDNDAVPASFVPNRNALFITLAHAYAQQIGAQVIVGGMCETDFSGYPDCREDFIQALLLCLNSGAAVDIEMVTPLMHIDKAQTFAMADNLGVLDVVIKKTHTCYEGNLFQYDWGKGCAECPACALRKRGWKKYQQIIGEEQSNG